MAITIEQQPQTLSMKRGNATYVCSSTNVANTGFKFIVVVKDGAGTEIGKYYIPANPSNRLIFDLAPVIDQEVHLDVNDANSDEVLFTMPNGANEILSGATTGFLKFEVEIGELYEVSGTLTEFTDLASDNVYFLDGATQYKRGYNYEWTDLEPTSSTSKAWLTDREHSASNLIDDQAIEIKASESDFGVICFLNDSTGIFQSDALQIDYRIYNSAGQQGQSDITIGSTYGIGSPSSVNTSEKLAYLGCLPANLNSSDNPFSFPPSAVSDWTYYSLQLLDGTINAMSRKLIVVRDERPCKQSDNTASLHWQNQVGGWDFFRFDGNIEETVSKTGKEYSKPIGSYGNADFDFNGWDRQKTSFYLDNKVAFNLKTGVINSEEQRLLSNVLKSQNVMLYYKDEWLPVVVNTNSFQVQLQTAQVKFASMTVELAQDQL